MVNAGDTSLAAMRSFAADRASPVPLYFQVAQHLERAIESGELPAGSLLLNEVDLADAVHLSRPTMRRAMQSLVDKGLVVRRRGIGTRVVQPKLRRPLGLTSLYDDLRDSGQKPRTRVLSLETVAADAAVARRLDVRRGSRVIEVVRLRSAGRKPIAKMTNFLPSGLLELTGDDLAEHGLYDLVRGAGITLHSATQTVGARVATSEEADLLQERRGAALLTMERVTHDDHGRVVEYGSHLYAASRYALETDLLSV